MGSGRLALLRVIGFGWVSRIRRLGFKSIGAGDPGFGLALEPLPLAAHDRQQCPAANRDNKKDEWTHTYNIGWTGGWC
jgi:hypothetical protein